MSNWPTYYAKAQAALDAATPGPCRVDRDGDEDYSVCCAPSPAWPIGVAFVCSRERDNDYPAAANATLWAACHGDQGLVGVLLKRCRALEELAFDGCFAECQHNCERQEECRALRALLPPPEAP